MNTELKKALLKSIDKGFLLKKISEIDSVEIKYCSTTIVQFNK